MIARYKQTQIQLNILWKIVQDDSGCNDILPEQAKNLISEKF